MQKITIIPISDEGRHLADALQQEFQALIIRRADVAKRWKDFDAFIFIGAMGICVRTIASLIEDKHTDPAVICVDSMGNHVISVLSGHVGGANELTRRVASALGADPVITTQSDNAGLWALDTLATQFDWTQRFEAPMLDLTQAVNALSQVTWDIHVVAIKNEVKEVLLWSGGSGQITAIDLSHPKQAFIFTREEEAASEAVCQSEGRSVFCQAQSVYLCEPNAAILKAGAYKLVGERFGLHKLDINTHLYTSETLVENFPGRVWKIQEQLPNHKLQISNANVLVRNYPLTAEQLKKKLHLRDGGTEYIIGCRVNGKPTVLLAERCH